MPLKPFRFIHASHLLLDHPLQRVGPCRDSGRQPPEPCSIDLGPILEDAAILAFSRIIDACLAHAADFLLLTGNCFDGQDVGLRGQVQLARGLERLADQEIPVFILAGDRDPWKTWIPSITFPGNVTFVGRDHNASWPVIQDGIALATIHNLQDQARRPETESSGMRWPPNYASHASDRPFSIGMIHGRIDGQWPVEEAGDGAQISPPPSGEPCVMNYVAWGGADSRQTISIPGGIAHDPGSPQGFSPEETGPRGCTLIQVDAEQQITQRFISTAPVRWERVPVTAPLQMGAADLLPAMHAALAKIERHPSDRVWLISWTVPAEGLVSEQPAHAQFPTIELPSDGEAPPVFIRTQAVHRHRPAAAPLPMTDGLAHGLAADYAVLLDEQLGHPAWSPAQCLRESSLHGGPWEVRLASLAPDLNPQQIQDEARRLGLRWFAAVQE